MNDALTTFVRLTRSRSLEHQQTMRLLAYADLTGQVVTILRQELDSMIRVVYLLKQNQGQRTEIIQRCLEGQKWPVSDRAMVDLTDRLHGWTRSVYAFGCAFIHLSAYHDYRHRDILALLPEQERFDMLEHCRYYHGGPTGDDVTFDDLVPYLPMVFEKILSNLECYVSQLEEGKGLDD